MICATSAKIVYFGGLAKATANPLSGTVRSQTPQAREPNHRQGNPHGNYQSRMQHNTSQNCLVVKSLSLSFFPNHVAIYGIIQQVPPSYSSRWRFQRMKGALSIIPIFSLCSLCFHEKCTDEEVQGRQFHNFLFSDNECVLVGVEINLDGIDGRVVVGVDK